MDFFGEEGFFQLRQIFMLSTVELHNSKKNGTR